MNRGVFSSFWKDCFTPCPLKRNQHTLPLDVGKGSPYGSRTASSPSCTRLPFPGGRPASIYLLAHSMLSGHALACSHTPLMFFLDQSLPLPRMLYSWDHPGTRKESLQRPTMGGSCQLQTEVWHPARGERFSANSKWHPLPTGAARPFFPKGTCGLRDRDHDNVSGPSSPPPCYIRLPYSLPPSPPLFHMLSPQEFLTTTTMRISLSVGLCQTPTWD